MADLIDIPRAAGLSIPMTPGDHILRECATVIVTDRMPDPGDNAAMFDILARATALSAGQNPTIQHLRAAAEGLLRDPDNPFLRMELASAVRHAARWRLGLALDRRAGL